MKKTMYKWFWAWSFDKEEKWLNEMAAKGQVLVSIGFCKYTFENCVPGEYNVRLELLENVPTHEDSQQYIRFIEETGAEHIGSIMRWVYFRKKTTEGEFNLFSDNASRIQHLNRILTIIGVIAGLNLYFGFNNLNLFFASPYPPLMFLPILNLSLGILVACGFLKLYYKRRKLVEQQNLFE